MQISDKIDKNVIQDVIERMLKYGPEYINSLTVFNQSFPLQKKELPFGIVAYKRIVPICGKTNNRKRLRLLSA